MFLHQKFDYTLYQESDTLNHESLLSLLLHEHSRLKPEYIAFDTETTGLDIMSDSPFLIVVGFDKLVFVFEPSRPALAVLRTVMLSTKKCYAHNAKFDYHMLQNIGMNFDGINIADTMIVARLTQYADSKERLALEHIGAVHVDPDSKAEKKVIRLRMSEIDKGSKAYLRDEFEERFPEIPFKDVFEAYKERVQFVSSPLDKYFEFIDDHYAPAGYHSVYHSYPQIVINYAADDVVIMLEYMKKALPVLAVVDPGLVTFERECQLIKHVCDMERTGLKVDVDYLLRSRTKMLHYKHKLYEELYDLTGKRFTVGQHEFIKKLVFDKFSISLQRTDEASLEEVAKRTSDKSLKRILELILELRSLEKRISTYIDGKLNDVRNGRVHTDVNNQGAVTGRVSSDLQQQPNEPLLDSDGNELFHPRKVFVAETDSNLVFIDFNQMELRVQANYTLMIGEGDVNLCRAYIPLGYRSVKTGEVYDPRNAEHLARANSGEWVDENGKPWKEVDLHGITTLNAFPHLKGDPNHPEFKELRKKGKRCNFLKLYQGGIDALMSRLQVPKDIAIALNTAFYTSFPRVRDYQNWVTKELILHGFVQNLYGRRYYMQDQRWFYKASNYVIQGSCADLVKQKEIEISEFLKGKKTKFLLPIHDELIFAVPDDEMYLVPQIKAIMEDTSKYVKYIPMLAEVSVSNTNWAEKKKV